MKKLDNTYARRLNPHDVKLNGSRADLHIHRGKFYELVDGTSEETAIDTGILATDPVAAPKWHSQHERRKARRSRERECWG